MKKVFYKTGEQDFWCREIVKDAQGIIHVMVDGYPHPVTKDFGEPIYPIRDFELINQIPETIFQVFSPDGFSIFGEKTFKSMPEAEENFKEWAKRFITQGYYSSNNGRISLDNLKESCVFKEFEKDKIDSINLIFLPKF